MSTFEKDAAIVRAVFDLPPQPRDADWLLALNQLWDAAFSAGFNHARAIVREAHEEQQLTERSVAELLAGREA